MSQENRRRGYVFPLAALAAMALFGCRMLIGDLSKECTTSPDCEGLGSGLVCKEGMCISEMLPAGCAMLGDPAAPITFGIISQLSRPNDGGVNLPGKLRQQAAELVLKQLNPPQRAGIRGKSIRIVSCDTVGVATAAADFATKLIDFGAVAIMTHGSTDTINAATKTVGAKVLLMAISATSPEITSIADTPEGGGTGLVWRVALSDALQGKVIAQELTPTDGGAPPRVGVVYLNDSYGQGLYNAFSQNYPGQQVGASYARQGEIDTAVNAIANSSPAITHGVLIAFPDDGVRILTAASAKLSLAGLPWFFSDSAKSAQILTPATDNSVSDQFGTAPASALRSLPDGGLVATQAGFWFNTNYRATYQEDPLGASYTANAFDATMLLALAANYATANNKALTGPGMAEALTRVSNTSASTVIPLEPTNFSVAAQGLDNGRINVEGASGKLDYMSNNSGDISTGEIEVWKLKNTGGSATFETVKIISSQ